MSQSLYGVSQKSLTEQSPSKGTNVRGRSNRKNKNTHKGKKKKMMTIHFLNRLHFSVVLSTITAANTSPPSWPSFLCSAPASSPGARPPPRPCGGRGSKVRGRQAHKHTHTHTDAGKSSCPGPVGLPAAAERNPTGPADGFWVAHDYDSLFLLGVQVPDQRVPLVDQYDQLVQQQLLSSLLGLRLLPVCNDTHGFRTTVQQWTWTWFWN